MSLSIYNPEQDIWDRIGKSGKIGQGRKCLLSSFTCLATAIAGV